MSEEQDSQVPQKEGEEGQEPAYRAREAGFTGASSLIRTNDNGS